jgi:hypothetical protein
MNDAVLSVFLAQDGDSDLLESLTAKPLVQRLEPQLVGKPEHSVEFTEDVLVMTQPRL